MHQDKPVSYFPRNFSRKASIFIRFTLRNWHIPATVQYLDYFLCLNGVLGVSIVSNDTTCYTSIVIKSRSEVYYCSLFNICLLAGFNKQHFPQALAHCALSVKAQKMSRVHGRVEGLRAERTEWCIYF